MTVAVAVDTDIGTDIDDTWALAMAVRSPELDVRLVTTVSGDPRYRARVARGLLGPGVPVAIGLGGGRDVHPGEPQAGLAAHGDSDLDGDGVGALVAACAVEPVTIVAMGPLTNLVAALERDPTITERARVVAMMGAVRVGYHGHVEPIPEYNVKVDVDACRAVLSAPWPVTITPVDTCGTVVLKGAPYQRVLAAREADPLVDRLLSTQREWLEAVGRPDLFPRRTTTLFDTVAVYLAHDESFVEIEDLTLVIDDDGLMRVDDAGPVVRVATRWRDQNGFVEHLVERLTVR